MKAEIAKLGNIGLYTPNLQKSLEFFRDIIGLEEIDHDKNSVYLRAWGDFEHHTLMLIEGDDSSMAHIGWQVKDRACLDEFEANIKAHGLEVARHASGTRKGVGELLSFEMASGHRMELYYDVDRPKAAEGKRSRLRNQPFKSYQRGVSPRRIDHVNINVPNPPEIHKFLTGALNFKIRECIQMDDGFVPAAWISSTPLVHDIAVMLDEKQRPGRLHHFCYACESQSDLLRAAEILREADCQIDLGPGRHGITQAMFLYVKDPGSGHRIELFAGGYLIFDPDWKPVVWSEKELADSIIWWGPELPSDFLGDSTGPDR